MIWDRIKEKINETFKQDNTQDKPKVFQTTDKLDKIKKNVEKKNTVLVYNPLSQRTFFKNPETDSYIDGKIEIGDEKTSDKEKVVSVVSTAIQSIKYDPKKQRAYVIFKNGDGTEYTYKVSPEEFDDFLNAASKSHHVAKEWNKNPHFSIFKKKK